MGRFLAGVAAAVALMMAGLFLFRGNAVSEVLPPAPAPVPQAEAQVAKPPAEAPAASPRTREQKRFDRYDKDRDGRVTRDEYLASRRKAYAKLDTNGDGRLSFEEWSAKTATKFATADKGRDGALDATEFATTAAKRRAPKRTNCLQPTQVADEG